MYTFTLTHACACTHTLCSYSVTKIEREKLHLADRHLQSSGNRQIFDAVNKQAKVFGQKIKYERQIQKYFPSLWA